MTHSTESNPSNPRTPKSPDPYLSSQPKETYRTIRAKKICIRSFCTPEDIRRYTFDGQFGTHAQYKSLYTKKESLEKNARQKNANVTLALEEENIIGFGVLNEPDSGERWLNLGPGLMMEVKAIEVSRKFRSAGIAGWILECLMDPVFVEDIIVYMVGYSWTWDLDGTENSALDYRNMLIRLFEPFGFQELQTNEPNICLKPENLFMARVGRHVSEGKRKAFKWLRFGVTP
jgi:acetoin utilization protein AcuA